MAELEETTAIGNNELSIVERRIIAIVRSLRPYDVLEILRQRDDPSILQIVLKNTVKETFPFSDDV